MTEMRRSVTEMRLIDADELIRRIPSEEFLAQMAVARARTIPTKSVKYFDEGEKVWKVGEVIVSE